MIILSDNNMYRKIDDESNLKQRNFSRQEMEVFVKDLRQDISRFLTQQVAVSLQPNGTIAITLQHCGSASDLATRQPVYRVHDISIDFANAELSIVYHVGDTCTSP